MHWASAISTATSLQEAVEEVSSSIRSELDTGSPDLVLAFVSPHHREQFLRLPAHLEREFGGAPVLGCSGGGVVGGGHEIEHKMALAVTAATLPGVTLHPFSVDPDDPPRSAQAWHDLVGMDAQSDGALLFLPEPFSSDTNALVRGMDAAFPGAPTVGGLASGGNRPGFNVLYGGQKVQGSGAVGLGLEGNLEVDTIVAQGCRPIGAPMFVTRAEGNLIRELDGERPSEVLQALYDRLPAPDQDLARRSLFLGIVMNPDRESYGRGDFLIRNIMGLDAKSGALAVGGTLQENLVVQFHLRDAEASAQELDQLLARYREDTVGLGPAGALMFSCLGRGRGLYGHADHDSNSFFGHLGRVPLGGFFCNGEIGPVQGQTHVHGYTSAFAMFRRRRAD